MKFNTKRYTIRKINEGDGFLEGITHEINLKEGYVFQSYDSHLEYAYGVEDLRDLIADIEIEEV